MGNLYREMRERQQEEFNQFPLGAAFGKEQFRAMMEGWGFSVNDTDKIISLGAGCYIRKTDKDAYREMSRRHEKEREDAIAADADGTGFIFDMFRYELANHEYGYTCDPTDAFNACGYDYEDVMNDDRLRAGFGKASAVLLKEAS